MCRVVSEILDIFWQRGMIGRGHRVSAISETIFNEAYRKSLKHVSCLLLTSSAFSYPRHLMSAKVAAQRT